ncbi:tRNA (adenosine(37)-N6)-threonylcarbamoyltransferase complex ATPase subunit type 1 TsaE [Candidatus Saganbacteria bacterium]|nr:tRNA (adenosine(37)-N6)-threonylcarbamoyltransferase complex ATPase subunit type 1 TsaE [Candidatus Saganbacteria bacterium]
MSNEILTTHSAEETVELGKKIGQELKPNDIVALYGGLGAGKTTLVQGIGLGLGIGEMITSPTFILINEYPGRIPLYHIDLYRLDDISQVEDLGIEEYFSKGGVCIIEWAEKLGNLLPKNAKTIKIEIVSENERKIWRS